ncbi:MAG: hypothetical protein QJR03_00070 [Sphaerobacter sp.]|nr:hypothetical protein [Sphaerobacter sp.]
MALRLAAFEPTIVEDAVFLLERDLGRAGEVTARVGDLVEPGTTIATASGQAARAVVLHVARELGISPDRLSHSLTKPIGSAFSAGEVVARTRRGLRNIVVTAPVAGTLTTIDEVAGTATLVPGAEKTELRALVYGQIDSVREQRGVRIRTRGARLRGVFAAGQETWGALKVAIDRPDRELTPDAVSADLAEAVVLGGMTVSAPALRRLAEVGARAVIVGSVSEGEVRRAVASGEVVPPAAFWRAPLGSRALARGLDRAPVAIVVTEGFGRCPMASPLFQFLAQREGQVASVLVPRAGSAAPPEVYFTVATMAGEVTQHALTPGPGVLARLVDPAHLGTVVTCRSGALVEPGPCGARVLVEVELPSGGQRRVPLANLELHTPPR